MEEDKKSLEEKSKEFFKLEIYPNFNGVHPVKIKNFEEKLPLINYLYENKYLSQFGDTVESFRYIATNEGRKWAGI